MSNESERIRTRSRAPGAAAHDDAAAIEPGRTSRSAALHRPARAVASGLVQCKTAGGLGAARLAGGDTMHDAAERGVSGAGSALPHLDAIQRSFGAHDVTGIRAFVGGGAASAAHALGAHAYATGSAAAFAATPDLHTAAHEAAHVIQQRSGLQLDGGIGQTGDAHERHADAVAGLIVQGRTAEALLDRYRRGGGGGRGVQLLGLDDELLLDEYIDQKNDEHDLNLPEATRRAKRREISKAIPETKRKGLQEAMKLVDAWVTTLLDAVEARGAELLAKQREKNKAEDAQKAEHKAKQEHKNEAPDDTASQSNAPSKPKKSYRPLDLSNVPMAPKQGFNTVAAQSAALPQPKATAAKASNAAPIISKVNNWKPGNGHDGCSATTLTTAELQEIVNWAEARSTKYFVKKGAGTGQYSAKEQLKIIHQQVTVASSGKRATYHITANSGALAALPVGEQDDT